VSYERERQRRDRLQEAADASQRSVDLVRTQYVSGLTNFQNVLDSQRSLFRQQDQLADSDGRVIKNLIDLNRALGGGWSLDAISQDSVLAQASEQAEAGPPLPAGAGADSGGDDR
jgi:outer membrane protein TolC